MSNFDENLGATSPRPERLTQAGILAAALALLDEVGLPDLSMRRLATKLDAQPSGLYWHFANKQTLFARISDHIVDHIVTEADQDAPWRERALTAACSLRDSLLAFRDAAEIVSSTLALGLGAEAVFDRIRRPLEDSAAPADMVEVATESIVFLVLGQVWHQQQRMAADSLGVTDASATLSPSDAETGRAKDPLVEGISLILDGLEQAARRRTPRGSSPRLK